MAGFDARHRLLRIFPAYWVAFVGITLFIGRLGAHTITEFNYRYAGAGEAHVFVGLRLHDAGREKAQLIAELESLGYDVLDISAFIKAGYTPTLTDNGLNTIVSFSNGETIQLLGVHATSLIATSAGYTM